MLDVLLCLACLAALCLFFASLRGVNSASAPLLALCCAILWFAAFGMLGLLRLGGGLFYGASLGLGVWAVYRLATHANGSFPRAARRSPGMGADKTLRVFHLRWRSHPNPKQPP